MGTSFYLVPSFAAFLSLFNHLCVPVFCSYCFFLFFLLPTISPIQTIRNINSTQWLLGKQKEKKKIINVCICLIYILFSNPLRSPMSCEFHVTAGVAHYFNFFNNTQLKASVWCIPNYGYIQSIVPVCVSIRFKVGLQQIIIFFQSLNNVLQFNFKSVKCLKWYLNCVYSTTKSQNSQCI